MRGTNRRLLPMYLMTRARASRGAVDPNRCRTANEGCRAPGRPARYNGTLPAARDVVDSTTRNLLIAVQVCFGVFPWLGKVAMQAFEPRTVLLWRLAVGSLVLGLVVLRRHRRLVVPSLPMLAAIFGLSLLGVAINQLLFLEGLNGSTAVNAGLLMCVIPVATCALAVAVGQERLTARRALGIACAVLGVAWLFLSRGAEVGQDTLVGDVKLTINALSYSCYLVLAKPVLKRVPQDAVVSWMFLFGLITVTAFSLDASWVPAAAEGVHWAALGGVLLFPTVLAYLGNTVVLSRTRASTTAAYILLQPLIAAALGITLLGERPEASLLITAAGVILGLWFVSMPERAGATERAPA